MLRFIEDKLEYLGVETPLMRGTCKHAQHLLVIGKNNLPAEVRRSFGEAQVLAQLHSAEHYLIEPFHFEDERKAIVLVGGAATGDYYALQVFSQLLTKNPAGTVFLYAPKVYDYPAFKLSRKAFMSSARARSNTVKPMLALALTCAPWAMRCRAMSVRPCSAAVCSGV